MWDDVTHTHMYMYCNLPTLTNKPLPLSWLGTTCTCGNVLKKEWRQAHHFCMHMPFGYTLVGEYGCIWVDVGEYLYFLSRYTTMKKVMFSWCPIKMWRRPSDVGWVYMNYSSSQQSYKLITWSGQTLCDSIMVCTRDLTLCMWRAHLCAHVNAPVLRNGHIYVLSDLICNIGCILKKWG